MTRRMGPRPKKGIISTAVTRMGGGTKGMVGVAQEKVGPARGKRVDLCLLGVSCREWREPFWDNSAGWAEASSNENVGKVPPGRQ